MSKNNFYRPYSPKYGFLVAIEIACKVCGVHYRPQLYDKYRQYLGLCYVCKQKYWKKRYREYYIPYFNALPAEKRQGIKKARYEAWRRWVQAHLPRRRAISLKSYHARKHAHVRTRVARHTRESTRLREERGIVDF